MRVMRSPLPLLIACNARHGGGRHGPFHGDQRRRVAVVGGVKEARVAGNGGEWLAAVLRSWVTVALLANLVVSVSVLIFALKVKTDIDVYPCPE
jgi:hypothetical protein